MHHEPIFQGVAVPNMPRISLEVLYLQLIETIGWIDADAAALLSCIDRFPIVSSPNGKQDIQTVIMTTFNIS